MVAIARKDYAALYGPTVGDGVRLADTSLVAVVEKDHAVYGDECLHGGGKTLRDGIGLAAGVTSAQGALDMLLCNVLVIDPVIGIVKGDLGIKDGRVVGLGKAGNPAIMDGVDPRLLVSAATTVRDCEGMIATPGAIDVHVHFDSAARSVRLLSVSTRAARSTSARCCKPPSIGRSISVFSVAAIRTSPRHWSSSLKPAASV